MKLALGAGVLAPAPLVPAATPVPEAPRLPASEETDLEIFEPCFPSGGFNGLDQINVAIPDGVTGAASVVVKTASGATSRGGVFITIQ